MYGVVVSVCENWSEKKKKWKHCFLLKLFLMTENPLIYIGQRCIFMAAPDHGKRRDDTG